MNIIIPLYQHISEITFLQNSIFPQSQWTTNDFLNLLHLKTSRAWVLEHSSSDYIKTIQGLILYQVISPEAEILNFFVSSSFRNQGFGQKLYSHSENNLIKNNIKKIFLDVSEDNYLAYKFYTKMNFKKINSRKGYYPGIITKQDRQNAILMEKNF